ncbi:MAG: PDZ domain-containing protein [Bdellovibrionales bacterium]|nr:PDZ domain-containing protein [Bdellovibrionales bacterium]
MRVGLWLVTFGMCWQVAAKDIQGEAAQWADVNLSQDYLSQFINNEICYSTETYLLSCVSAISSAGALLPAPLDPALKELVFVAEPGAESTTTWERFYAEKRRQSERMREFALAHYPLAKQHPADRLDFEALLTTIMLALPPHLPATMVRGYALTGHLQIFDPHAYVVPARLLESMQSTSQKRFVGIGLNLDFLSEGVLVHEVFAGSPAAEAGLMPDDRILAVAPDGQEMKSVAGISPEMLYDLLPGEQGSLVALRIQRGNTVHTFTLRRGAVQIAAVSSQLIGSDGRTGYIQLRSFAALDTCRKVKESIDQLTAAGAKSLILDLRGNLGGEKLMALCVAGLFVGQKTKIVGTKALELEIPSLGKMFRPVLDPNSEILWENGAAPQITRLPLVVLINALSASASELVAGALQDEGRAYLVGETSAGKASVQVLRSPPDNPTISIARTIARFYQPSLRSNQIVGVRPNFDQPLRFGAQEVDRFYPREGDMYPNALPAVVPEWQDPRHKKVQRISKCVEKNGYDLREVTALGLRGRADYQKAYALAVLKCL